MLTAGAAATPGASSGHRNLLRPLPCHLSRPPLPLSKHVRTSVVTFPHWHLLSLSLARMALRDRDQVFLHQLHAHSPFCCITPMAPSPYLPPCPALPHPEISSFPPHWAVEGCRRIFNKKEQLQTESLRFQLGPQVSWESLFLIYSFPHSPKG